jgi:hypothetical protein
MLEGVQTSGDGAKMKRYSRVETRYPYQLVVRKLPMVDPRWSETKALSLTEQFPIGLEVRFLFRLSMCLDLFDYMKSIILIHFQVVYVGHQFGYGTTGKVVLLQRNYLKKKTKKQKKSISSDHSHSCGRS